MPDAPNYDDANFALRIFEARRESELRKARSMVGDVLDGAPWETVAAVNTWGHKQNAHFRQVTSFWDMVASFVNRGIFHPDVYLDTCGEALYTYSVLKPHIGKVREGGSPRFMAQTEKVVADHPQLRERVETIDKARADWFAKEAAAMAAKSTKKPSSKKSGAKNGAKK